MPLLEVLASTRHWGLPNPIGHKCVQKNLPKLQDMAKVGQIQILRQHGLAGLDHRIQLPSKHSHHRIQLKSKYYRNFMYLMTLLLVGVARVMVSAQWIPATTGWDTNFQSP